MHFPLAIVLGFFSANLLSQNLALAAVREALRPQDTISRCVVSDPRSGHRFRPNCKEVIVRAGQRSSMSFNAEGLRDKNYSSKPAPGWTRILLVGSSRMVGPGLAESETPPRRLESHLRKSLKKLEVINASVEGYTPVQQASRLKEWISAYSPTLVVLQLEFQQALNFDTLFAPYVVERDVNVRILPWMKPIAHLLGLSESDYQSFKKIITLQSAAYRAWRTAFCSFRYKAQLDLTNCMLSSTLDAVLAMQKAALEAGAKFLLVTSTGLFTNDLLLSPAFDSESATYWDSRTRKLQFDARDVGDLLRKQKVDHFMLSPLSGRDFQLNGDYHFNAAGADLFARGLAIRLRGFLD